MTFIYTYLIDYDCAKLHTSNFKNILENFRWVSQLSDSSFPFPFHPFLFSSHPLLSQNLSHPSFFEPTGCMISNLPFIVLFNLILYFVTGNECQGGNREMLCTYLAHTYGLSTEIILVSNVL